MRVWPLIALLVASGALPGQTSEYGLNPAIQKIVAAISDDHIAATLKRLEAFGTRHASA